MLIVLCIWYDGGVDDDSNNNWILFKRSFIANTTDDIDKLVAALNCKGKTWV